MPKLRFLILRLVAQRFLALGVIVTLAFGVGVMATGPIYANGAREFIAASGLASASAPVVDVRVDIYATPSFDLARADGQVRGLASRLPIDTIVTQGDATVAIGSPSVSVPLLFRDGQQDHLRFRSGRAPGPDEIALPFGLSWSADFRTGDRIVVVGAKHRRTTLTVSGIFDPPEPDDYWFGSDTPFPVGEAEAPVPVVVDPVFARTLVAKLDVPMQYDWDLYLARDGVTYEQALGLPGAYESFKTDVYHTLNDAQQPVVDSGLPSLVAGIEREVQDLQVPILLVLAQILVVTLFVLAGVGVLLVSRQSFELAVLHSRGVSTASLMVAQALQACVAAAIAWPIGIVTAASLAGFAAFTNGLRVAGVPFPIRISASALLLGAGAAVLGAVVLALPSLAVVRRTIVDERSQASRESRPMLARVPVELLVLPVGLFALTQLRVAGEAPSTGGVSLDPILLFGPTLVVLGASFLVVRILSWVAIVLDRRIGRFRRLSSYLAGRRLARAPGVAFASVVLLTLSIGLLFVSTSYRATTLQSHADAAHAYVGADWVASVATPADDPEAVQARLPADMSAVAQIPPAGFAGAYSTRPTALAIDPTTFASAAWWRPDFAGQPLDALLDSIRSAPVGAALPEGARDLVVGLDAPPEATGMMLQASFAHADGSVTATSSQPIVAGPGSYTMDVTGATRLLSFTFEASTTVIDAVPLRIVDVRIDGTELSLDGWVPMHVRAASGRLRAEGTGWRFDARFGLGTGPVGVEPRPPAIPAIVSTDIAANEPAVMRLRLGDQLLDVRPVATATSFPSIAPRDPFIVVPSPALFDLFRAVPGALATPTNVWARGEDDPSGQIQTAGFPVVDMRSADTIRTQLAQNPQSLAVGLDAAAAIAGLGLVIAGVTASLYFAQRRRDFEFASLRALGAAVPSLRAAIAKEQIALIGAAAIAGVLVGDVVLRLATAPLVRTFGATFPRPVVVVDMRALSGALVVIAAAATVAVAAATKALLRSSVSGVLRGDAE